jgi:signal transduction histidine kinase
MAVMNGWVMTGGTDSQMAVARPPGTNGQAGRAGLRIATGLLVTTVLAAIAGAALTMVAWGDLTARDGVSNLGTCVAAIAYATLGALIIRRAGNLVGWLMLGEGAGLVFLALGSAYAVTGITTHPGTLPAPRVVGALAECDFIPVFAGLAAMLLLFPSGGLPSRRWRPAAAAGLLVTCLTLAGFMVSSRLVALPAPGGVSLRFRNPLAVRLLGPVLSASPIGSLNGLPPLFVVLLGGALVSLIARYRAGDRKLRQQMKWLALAAGAVLAAQVVAPLALAAGQGGKAVESVAYTVVPIIVLFGIPAVMAIAILRHGLFDIDVIISRAVVYGLLSAAFTIVYAGIVLGIGTFAGHRGGPVLTVAAAVCIALLFQPLRHRFRQFANRLVYGERATPYQVLSDFAEDIAGQLDFTEAVDRMVSVLAGATGADRAEAWIRVGAQLRPAAAWPRGTPPPPAVPLDPSGALPPFESASRAVAVRHSGELLGALSLRKPRNEPLTGAEDKLLQHLASQAGLVLRNAQLTADLRATIEELRASRRRLVEAQDAERRKIERNLHDGAQQQLIALRIQLSLLEDAAEDPGAVRQITPLLKDGLRAALDDLRDLARGIYPPLLAEQGLVAALQAQVRKSPLPVLIEADGIGRYPPDTETTVYFCTLEALQNIAKYAGASQAAIRLACPDGSLQFIISDDGAGFDTAKARHGSGLQGIADRLAALGGTLDIHSQPGHGTTLNCRIPVPAQDGKGYGTSIPLRAHATDSPAGTSQRP